MIDLSYTGWNNLSILTGVMAKMDLLVLPFLKYHPDSFKVEAQALKCDHNVVLARENFCNLPLTNHK